MLWISNEEQLQSSCRAVAEIVKLLHAKIVVLRKAMNKINDVYVAFFSLLLPSYAAISNVNTFTGAIGTMKNSIKTHCISVIKDAFPALNVYT